MISRNSCKVFKKALSIGYLSYYVYWGLGYLKLTMAKKLIHRTDFHLAKKYLDKAEHSFNKMRGELFDIDKKINDIFWFAIYFNRACIYSSHSIILVHEGDLKNALEFRNKSKKQLMECTYKVIMGVTEWDPLSLDLLDVWYFDIFRSEEWFKDIYKQAKTKPLCEK